MKTPHSLYQTVNLWLSNEKFLYSNMKGICELNITMYMCDPEYLKHPETIPNIYLHSEGSEDETVSPEYNFFFVERNKLNLNTKFVTVNVQICIDREYCPFQRFQSGFGWGHARSNNMLTNAQSERTICHFNCFKQAWATPQYGGFSNQNGFCSYNCHQQNAIKQSLSSASVKKNLTHLFFALGFSGFCFRFGICKWQVCIRIFI